MHVAIKNGNVEHIVARSCGHILHMSLDLLYMEPFTIALLFLDCHIVEKEQVYRAMTEQEYKQFL